MTNAPESQGGLRAVTDRIDRDIALETRWHYDQSLVSPRLDRLEAKLAYMVAYIEFLEKRIENLERRVIS